MKSPTEIAEKILTQYEIHSECGMSSNDYGRLLQWIAWQIQAERYRAKILEDACNESANADSEDGVDEFARVIKINREALSKYRGEE